MPLTKTEAGQQAFKDRQGPIAPRLRPAFILFDGRRSTADVIAATGIGPEDVASLCALGLLAEALEGARATIAAEPVPAPVAAASSRSEQQRYQDGYQVATRLTGELGLRGLRLNLAVEAARSHAELVALAPRIREAVGAERFAALDRALHA